MQRKKVIQSFLIILLTTLIAAVIDLPLLHSAQINLFGKQVSFPFGITRMETNFLGLPIKLPMKLNMGLDIQGGMQVVLQADMSQIPPKDRDDAIESAKEIILKRVDAYGITEPNVQTAKKDDQYRIIVELPGVKDSTEALNLVGRTAKLEFALMQLNQIQPSGNQATAAAQTVEFKPIGLTGKDLEKARLDFDENTGKPRVAISFNQTGAKTFAKVTKENTGKRLAILLDGKVVTAPVISTPIIGGQAVITGEFTVEEAKNLSIQLNAGALPVPIKVLEQRQLGASLGQQAVADSIRAGLIGLALVMLFMVLVYGRYGLVADMALFIYAILTLAIYKSMHVTLTLPGIAGLILSIGMAVDANILIFERIKEELRAGKAYDTALELGFGRAWDSIKDANVATILTALVLINPANFPFLSTSGLVRGFGITLLIGVILGLISGVVITRTLMRLIFEGKQQ